MSFRLPLRQRIVRYTWDRLAKRNPTYAILTDPSKSERGWDPGEFQEEGRREVETILTHLRNTGHWFSPELGLDYGCGIGRCTAWLEPHFHRFVGVDISPAMLAAARTRVRPSTELIDAVNYESNPPSGVSFLYSRLVLQHNSLPAMEAIIRRWCSILAPGGILVFQAALPRGGHAEPRRQWWGFLLFLAGRQRYFMEMHAIRRERIFELLEQGGVDLIDDVEDGGLEDPFESRTFFCRKR